MTENSRLKVDILHLQSELDSTKRQLKSAELYAKQIAESMREEVQVEKTRLEENLASAKARMEEQMKISYDGDRKTEELLREKISELRLFDSERLATIATKNDEILRLQSTLKEEQAQSAKVLLEAQAESRARLNALNDAEARLKEEHIHKSEMEKLIANLEGKLKQAVISLKYTKSIDPYFLIMLFLFVDPKEFHVHQTENSKTDLESNFMKLSSELKSVKLSLENQSEEIRQKAMEGLEKLNIEHQHKIEDQRRSIEKANSQIQDLKDDKDNLTRQLRMAAEVQNTLTSVFIFTSFSFF